MYIEIFSTTNTVYVLQNIVSYIPLGMEYSDWITNQNSWGKRFGSCRLCLFSACHPVFVKSATVSLLGNTLYFKAGVCVQTCRERKDRQELLQPLFVSVFTEATSRHKIPPTDVYPNQVSKLCNTQTSRKGSWFQCISALLETVIFNLPCQVFGVYPAVCI